MRYLVVPLILGTLITTALACTDCQRHISIANPPVVPGSDGADPCSQACAKRAANGCSGTFTVCLDACSTDQAQGVGSQLDPTCILRAQTLDELGACDDTCKGTSP